ncbi:TerC family protein [Acidipropionibacterium timonense]|uniref:TerC family protein n=1 Tax=Acidipropionibacterium timonense TaxID=2161818 RepID=UPI00102FD0CD|nr:TerC family protein [Acidipropionibacterium timonense]
MHIHPYVWIVTIVVMAGLLAFDVGMMRRHPHVPSPKECAGWVSMFVGMAVVFGLGVWWLAGSEFGGQFFAVWVTEYSLSMDNLFIFIIIMAKFKVPERLQQFALLVGIIIALVFRGVFIALGRAVLTAWAWVFFLFGVFLLYSAVKLVLDFIRGESEEDAPDNPVMAWIREKMPTTGDYRGTRFVIRERGHLLATSLVTVTIALGTTDLLFALDSIPASYGLTGEPYLIFTANVFALMGLRQLYFLIGNLLNRLVYLPLGLAVVLGFIGLKLLGHAMHHYHLDQSLGFPIEVPVSWSLGIIVGTLLVTMVASLIQSRLHPGAGGRD